MSQNSPKNSYMLCLWIFMVFWCQSNKISCLKDLIIWIWFTPLDQI